MDGWKTRPFLLKWFPFWATWNFSEGQSFKVKVLLTLAFLKIQPTVSAKRDWTGSIFWSLKIAAQPLPLHFWYLFKLPRSQGLFCQKSHATLGTEISQQKQGESAWLNLKLDVKRYAQRDAQNINQVSCWAWCPTGQRFVANRRTFYFLGWYDVRVFVGFCLILPKSWLTIVEGDRTFISDCVCKERCLLHDES